MNCDKAKKILLEENINYNTFERLAEHIQSCPDCSKLFEAGRIYENIVSSAAKPNPEMNYAEITDSVFNEINSDKPEEHDTSIFRRFENLLLQPVAKLAIASLLLFIVSSYLFEEYKGIAKIKTLESYFNEVSSSGQLKFRTAESFSQLQKLLNYSASHLNLLNTSSEDIIVEDSDLLDIFSLLIMRETDRNVELRDFLAHSEIDIADGLTAGELRKIETVKEKLIKLIEINIYTGGY